MSTMIPKPIKIVVMALGGQGGGVLSGWIADVCEKAGFLSQSTSVPGVAQRTGATIYYVEAFPAAAARAAGETPVLALMPTPGDVDIVIASELMEAGRAILRGFVSADRTTLITSTHRVYAIGEKSHLGSGMKNADRILAAASEKSRSFIGFDMEALATENGSVISATLFGALAGSAALPIERSLFEDTIRASGKAVETNLAAFSSAYEAAKAGGNAKVDLTAPESEAPVVSAPLLAEINRDFPEPARALLQAGAARCADYQDLDYAGPISPNFGFFLIRMRNLAEHRMDMR